jgi:hypothetical protein
MHARATFLGLFLPLAVVSCGGGSPSSQGSSASAADAGVPLSAQTSFAVPTRKAGETWTTHSVTVVPPPATADDPPGPAPFDTTTYVDIVGERGAYVGRGVGADGIAVQLTYNVDGQLVTAGTCSFTPASNTITFPLEVGRKWAVDYTNCYQTHTFGTGEVVGREAVPTAAFGSVDALKIVVKTTSFTPAIPDRSGESTTILTSTLYWAPQFGTFVKELYEIPLERGTTTITAELVKYTRPQ